MADTGSIEKARAHDEAREHPTLFSLGEFSAPAPSAETLCKKIGLNWISALDLHAQGWLSFDPRTASSLSPAQEAELSFLGSLVVSGCDHSVLGRLLSRLPKPYAYRADRVYYDWTNQTWRLLEDTDDIEDRFDEWVEELIGWQELDRLERLRERVENAITYLRERRRRDVG